MFISILMSFALSTIPSRADDLVYRGLKPIPTTSALAPDVVDSIKKTAHVIAAWNPEQNEIMLQYILIQRVRKMGIRDGLTKPTIILIDAASLAQAPAIIAALVPQLERQDPKTAKQILEALNVHGFSRADLARMGIETDLTSMRNETLDLIHSRYGRNARESDLLPDLKNDWQLSDPTGIGGAIFGPGSYVHALGMDEIPSKAKSPILGMTKESLEACYSRCVGAAKHGAVVGGIVGGVIGVVGGVVAGTALGGPPGTIEGIELGFKTGPPSGAAVGAGIGWGLCSSKFCEGRTEERKTPPKPETPSPSPSNDPQPSSPPSHDPDSGGGQPSDPPATDSGGHSGGDDCHPGDQSCADGKFNPDADPDHVAGSDTTRLIRGRASMPGLEIWQQTKLAPYVLPGRRDEFGKVPGFERSMINARGRR